MALRDMFARLMGQRSAGSAPPSFADLLQQESLRGDIAGQSARDRAAMRYNQMQGGPVSTAYSPPKPAATPAAKPAAAKPAAAKPAVDKTKTASTGGVQLAEDRATRFRPSDILSPDLAPSPNPYAPGSPVDPRTSIGAFQGPPMPAPLPSDLAPSPNPYAPDSPVDPRLSASLGVPQRPPPAPIASTPLIVPGQASGSSPILGNNQTVVGGARPILNAKPYRSKASPFVITRK
jgi:hypothetical protein